MNNDRRKDLKKAIKLLDDAYDVIDAALGEEQDCLENLPENLQGSSRYESMTMAIESLEDALEKLDDARSSLEDATE
jgi:ABC-type transporter Mla subunit MlaD